MTNNTRTYTRLTAAAALLGMSSTPLIHPQVDVSGISAGGAAVSDSDIAENAFVPNFYYSRRISDDLTAGLGIYSPFGLATSYSKSFASLVGTETSEITTVSINPSLAFRLNEKWTVGAGFSVMYVDGKLTALNTATDGVPGAVGGKLFALEGDDWAYGWNIGVLFEVTENTRIGLQYRSSFDVSIEGSAKGDLIDAATRTPNNSVDTTLDIELPDVAELSVFHQINDAWAVHADITWTGWSKFKALSPNTGTPADVPLATTENWEDAFPASRTAPCASLTPTASGSASVPPSSSTSAITSISATPISLQTKPMSPSKPPAATKASSVAQPKATSISSASASAAPSSRTS